MALDIYAEEAIAHEAGHLVVSRALDFPTFGLFVEIKRQGANIGHGSFGTRSIEPPDSEIRLIPPAVVRRYSLFLAGGLAGQMVEGKTPTGFGAEQDRKQLERLNTGKTLEELAAEAVPLIEERREVFRRLVDVITARYTALISNPTTQAGRHVLLPEADIQAIFQQIDDDQKR
jgi:hypothetical protein